MSFYRTSPIVTLFGRGLFRTEYEGKTLRENLGLKRPVSRYAAAGLDRNLDAAK